jgi:FecR protein
MAITPPAAQPPALPPAGASAPLPPAKKSGCAGCSVGCLGCIGVVVLVILLVLGGGYFFLVAQASAGVASPAALLVASTPVDVGHNDGGYQPATSGQSLDAGSSVRTGHTGHATIQFPDGSLMRVSPDTTVTIESAQLSNAGNLKSATLQQKIGRTLSTVQHLAGGASFQVGGHSVSAAVRGTEFEVVVRTDSSNQIKVFDGSVAVSGQTNVTVNAGEQVDADPNGKLAAKRPIQPDKQDPFALASQCAKAVSGGTTAGTTQTTTGNNISTGQTAEVDYSSPGGTVSFAMCYPGSLITLSVIDPLGVEHASRNGTSPVTGNLSGPPGLYRAIVHAINVPGGEPFTVSFATNVSCASANVDTGTVVRKTLSTDQLQASMSQSGVTGITIKIVGTSSNSARLYYYSNIGGTEISWTIDFYAATPNLGAVVTQITVRGINITTQVVSRLTSANASISTIPQDFIVDRVYSCAASGGLMVMEGHRA